MRECFFLVFCCPILLWCGLLLLQLICRFDMLCIQRWSFAYLGCKEFIWVTVAFLTTWKTVPILLWHQQSILTQNCCSLDIFFFFGTFFVKPRADYVGKIPKDQQFLKRTDQPVCHQQSCHVQTHWNHPSSSVWCSVWTSGVCLEHVFMPKCIELLNCLIRMNYE